MNLYASVLRTVVPAVAGLVLGLWARVGLDISEPTTTAAVTTAVMVVYYLVWRGLEELASRIGWAPLRLAAGLMLGWARPPDYSGPDDKLSAMLRDVRGGPP